MFGLMGGALLATTAPQALMWAQSEWNVDYILARIDAECDAFAASPDFCWTPEEIEAHKRLGGWPS
jgi:hypothetical protein